MRVFNRLMVGMALCAGLSSVAFSQEAKINVLTPASEIRQGNSVQIEIQESNSLKKETQLFYRSKPIRLYGKDAQKQFAVIGLSVDEPVGSATVTLTDSSGQPIASTAFTVLKTAFQRQNISVSKKTKGLQPLPGEMAAIQALKTVQTPQRFWELPFQSPTPDCENSPFGVKRYHNGVYTQDYHKGVDLRSPAGRPVRAVSGGVVQIARPDFRLHGGTVGLNHGQGVSSVYIHLSKVLVKPGQKVQAGEPVGLVGSTGFATGPHLHWGLYANGVPVNPNQWLLPVKKCY